MLTPSLRWCMHSESGALCGRSRVGMRRRLGVKSRTFEKMRGSKLPYQSRTSQEASVDHTAACSSRSKPGHLMHPSLGINVTNCMLTHDLKGSKLDTVRLTV